MDKKYKRFPLVALKFVNKLRGWYPVPLVFNWKSPQDEINEARESQRTHRRRAKRVFLYKEGAFADDGEIDKMENGPDMTFVKVQQDPNMCIGALPNVPLDQIVAESMMISHDDLNIVSGTSADQRGQTSRTTATQAGITDQRMQLREARGRVQVANVLKEIGRLTLLTIKDNFSDKFWVKVRTNRGDDDFLTEVQEAQEEWRQFTSDDLGEDEDFQVDISIDTISPIENAQSKAAFVDFLSMLNQFPQLAFDPVLVREAAYRCGYRNEKVISRMAMMAKLAAIGQVEQAKAKLGIQSQGPMPQPQDGNTQAQNRVEQMTPPTQAQIETQMAGQMGPSLPVQ
jgi:hypothetical protein